MKKILALLTLCASLNTYAYDAFECKNGKLFYSEDGRNYIAIDNISNSLECVLKKDNYSKKELETDFRSMHSNSNEIENRFYLEIGGKVASSSDFQDILNEAFDYE